MATEHVIICDAAERRELGYSAFDQEIPDRVPSQAELDAALDALRREDALSRLHSVARSGSALGNLARDFLIVLGLDE